MPGKILVTALALLALTACGAKADPNWRTVDPENLMVIETTKGRIIVELRPDLAPQAVARMKQLTRDGLYDGLQFHRVIDGFVAQTGNPGNKDGGKSDLSNLPAEFTARLTQQFYHAAVTRTDGSAGFLGTLPVETTSAAEDQRRGEGTTQFWGAYCPGVVGMGRDDGFDTANSEFFFMRGAARRLDRLYTVVGMTVEGIEHVYELNVGEPPAQPDVMTRVRIAADIPEDERPLVQAMYPDSLEFQKLIGLARSEKRADFSICDLRVSVKVTDPPA
ncbi:MAG: peptidylprolyl isomerase [Micropepsaceae bacterium]